jgi:branched-chain amino acid transport system substrate-binding protein|tara:strand:- start:224682 stop:225848 length:1167 start_codon:yes stop_codon:yes gene_type:complete
MMKIRILAAAATMLLASMAMAQEPVKIGFMGVMSGPQGVLGEDMYAGFMLAVDREGGKLGGIPVEVFKEDSQLKPELAVQLVDKLIEREKVSIITGVTFSNIMMAIQKPVTDREVFLIGSNAGPAPIAGKLCNAYTYSSSWQNDMQSEVVGKYATEQGYKRVIAMAPNYQAGKDYIAGFKRYFEGDEVEEIYTPLNQLDFSAELTRVAVSKPDAVFIFYPGGLGINFVRQYQQLGLMNSVPLLATATVDGTTLPAMKEAALGVNIGTFWSPDLDVPENKVFLEEFEKKHNRIPSQYAAQSYDAALLIASALKKVNGDMSDKKAFAKALKEADFNSVRGSFKFGNNNFPIQNMHMLRVVKDDNGQIVLKTIATPLKDHQDAYHQECSMQ